MSVGEFVTDDQTTGGIKLVAACTTKLADDFGQVTERLVVTSETDTTGPVSRKRKLGPKWLVPFPTPWPVSGKDRSVPSP